MEVVSTLWLKLSFWFGTKYFDKPLLFCKLLEILFIFEGVLALTTVTPPWFSKPNKSFSSKAVLSCCSAVTPFSNGSS